MGEISKVAAILIASILMLVPAVRAQSLFEKLVSPGDVVTPHTKWEKTCESCHEPFSKSSQRRLCLDCHKDIASDISRREGFHGKRHQVLKAECKTCHTDHKGREADIVQLDEETFNHDFTDFKLKGAHQTADCSACHKPKNAYRKAPSTCFACHESDDKHKGSLGKECASCHDEVTWKKHKTFDHSKTRFALEGPHKEVACNTCHAGERYKDIPRTCIACHRMQDVHRGTYGEKCETCHRVSKWDKVTFDHAKSTKFPLKGAHASSKCASCHKGDLYKDKLSTTCVSCHRADDAHKGQLGTRCETCHNESKWIQKVTFDHDLTRFPLIGMHATIACEECHRTQTYKDTPASCASCHKDTHHEGTLGTQCGSCHNPNGWKFWRFDHDKQTKFMLTGAHKGIRCEGCHNAPAMEKVSAPTACVACHSSDDAHRGTFGRACDKCHTTTSFREGLQQR